MTTVEVLKAARAKIERGWTQRRSALYDGEGHEIAWCMSGATCAVDDKYGGVRADRFLRLVIDAPIVAWNDAPGRTKEEVLAAFDAAIALADAATSRDAAGMETKR